MSERTLERGRIVRIDGETQAGSGVLADHLEIVWLTPSMDGLFPGPASERRRFLDRLILCFDPGYRDRRAASNGRWRPQQIARRRCPGHRATLRLRDGHGGDGGRHGGSASEAVAAPGRIIGERKARDPNSAFPWCTLAIEGAWKPTSRACRRSRRKTFMPAFSPRSRSRSGSRTDARRAASLGSEVGHGPKADAGAVVFHR